MVFGYFIIAPLLVFNLTTCLVEYPKVLEGGFLFL